MKRRVRNIKKAARQAQVRLPGAPAGRVAEKAVGTNGKVKKGDNGRGPGRPRKSLRSEPPVKISTLELKALIRHRDGYVCVECGMTAIQHCDKYGRTLDVHRLTPGGGYTMRGCVTLCRACHSNKPRAHKGVYPKGFFVRIPQPMIRPLIAAAHKYRRTVAQTVCLAFEEWLKSQ